MCVVDVDITTEASVSYAYLTVCTQSIRTEAAPTISFDVPSKIADPYPAWLAVCIRTKCIEIKWTMILRLFLHLIYIWLSSNMMVIRVVLLYQYSVWPGMHRHRAPQQSPSVRWEWEYGSVYILVRCRRHGIWSMVTHPFCSMNHNDICAVINYNIQNTNCEWCVCRVYYQQQ